MDIFFRLSKKKYFIKPTNIPIHKNPQPQHPVKLKQKLKQKLRQKLRQKLNKKKRRVNTPNIVYPDVNESLNKDNIALLVGICYFSDDYTSQQLYGCINDIENIRNLLISRGFLTENIMFMADDITIDRTSKLFPTKANILLCYDNLLKGNVINSLGQVIYHTNNVNRFFYYSAHGTKIDIKSPKILDTQYDQMDFIIPYDFIPNDINSVISDIEIKNIINNNAPINFKISMFFDSCLNQTICNLTYGYYSTLNEKNDKKYPHQITYNNITKYTNENIINNSQVFQMSSSEDKQYSIDVNNGVNSDGAYTMAFLSCFEGNFDQVYNWKDFLMAQRLWLKKNGYSQIPQLSSAKLTNINTETINF